MSETTNYGLYLTEDNTEKFKDWREKMNGANDSNMVKIDTALGKKADSSVIITATLYASEWVGTSSPFSQELVVDGLLKDTNGLIGITQDATAEQRDVVREAMLAISEQEDGKLVIVADGKIPELDIPVNIIMLG